MIESFKYGLPGLTEKVLLGTLLGFAVGLALKKSLRLMLVLIGILVIIMLVLARYNFIFINWSGIENAYNNFIYQFYRADPVDLLASWLQGSLAVAGSAGMGLFLGLKKG